MTSIAKATSRSNFFNVLIARNHRCDWRSTSIQLLLIVLWHWTVFAGTIDLIKSEIDFNQFELELDVSVAAVEFRFISDFISNSSSKIGIPAVICFEGILALFVFRVVVRKLKPAFSVFVKYWWRTNLWGIVGLPITGLLIAEVSWEFYLLSDIMSVLELACVFPLIWVLISTPVPALLFKDDFARGAVRCCLKCGRDACCARSGCDYCMLDVPSPPVKMSRWRPVCPDCGYSIRRIVEQRCPECGNEFPATGKAFRRWAFRRLPWDRSPREFVAKAYIKSLCWIVFLPWRAARGLAIPDRTSRAIRWAMLHFAGTVISLALLSHGLHYVRWLQFKLFPSILNQLEPVKWNDYLIKQTPIWAVHTLIAWGTVLLVAVLTGCALSYLLPGRHRAAKLGGVKWSLYIVPIYLLATVVWYPVELLFTGFPISFLAQSFWSLIGIQDTPYWFLVTVYAVWWSWGISANQFNRRRQILACLPYFWLYFGTWLLIMRLISPFGALEPLL
ncbi:MAG: hypothetical protein R3E58_18825 [Phycisphaerae bacterium]|nr:hypothetical protein [Phycisphaerales bacterium]